jgi:Ca-activated chloride channel family protein
MKFIKYSRYTGGDLGISAEDLMRALSDYFLQSGFEGDSLYFSEMGEQSIEELKEAIRQAVESGELFDDDKLEQMMQQIEAMSPEQMQQLVDRLTGKLAEEGYVSISGPEQSGKTRAEKQPGGAAGGDGPRQRVRFELTD